MGEFEKQFKHHISFIDSHYGEIMWCDVIKIIKEAKKEFPLMIPPSPLLSKERIIDYMIDTMKWFEKWFGE